MIDIVVYFLIWTLFLYWIHRIAHTVNFFKKFHLDHHRYVNRVGSKSRWEPNNLLLYNDTRYSTIDLWLTEVIPTLLFSAVTGQWWIFVFYYCWAAFLQEYLEHKKGVNVPFFTFGDWHLKHHRHYDKNYGLFFPLWDKVFGTEIKV